LISGLISDNEKLGCAWESNPVIEQSSSFSNGRLEDIGDSDLLRKEKDKRTVLKFIFLLNQQLLLFF